MEKTTPRKAFASSIFYKARALENKGLKKSEQQRLREAISDDIKKYSNFVAHGASKAAGRLAGRLSPPVDLVLQNWHTQHKFDRTRALFIAEHFNPVAQLRQDCIKAGSIEEIEQLLAEKLRIVWITREEDQRLNGNGHRSKRPDPDAAYRQAEIEIDELR